MTKNIYSLLTDYLRYQRDIGVDGIVFDHGSAVVRKILPVGGGAGRPAARSGGAGANAGSGGYSRGAPVKASTQPPAPKAVGAGADTSPLSKLSKIKPVDALDPRMPLKRARKAPALSSGRRERLAELYRETAGCGKCALSRHRAKVVFGSGSADGKLLAIGGVPERPEDIAGLPFLGGAGELFDRILEKMGLDRKNDVFASYAQKCLGPDGFDRECAGACRPLLDRQIEIIEPKAILVFGEAAANFLLGDDAPVEQLRAINHTYMNKPVVVTYDLSLMLKEKQYRFDAWEDMKKILAILDL